MADYTMELQTGLIELRWLHYGKLRGAGPATTAVEEQGKQAWLGSSLPWRDMAINSVHKRARATGRWGTAKCALDVGRMSINHKTTMAARSCAPQ